jgi:hypothetical protein
LEQLEKCAQHDEIKGIYWEWNYSNDLSQLAHDLCKKYNKEFYLALPYILENDLWTYYQEKLLYWENTDIDGYLIRNYGSFYFLKNSRKMLTQSTAKEKILPHTKNCMIPISLSKKHKDTM